MKTFLIALVTLGSVLAHAQSSSSAQQKIEQENVWRQQKIDQENMWFNAQFNEYVSLLIEKIENECIEEVSHFKFESIIGCKVSKIKEQTDKLRLRLR